MAQGYANDSCWGNCGYLAQTSASGGGLGCACDAGCETYGDCCRDKHTYCPVINQDGTSKALCPMLQGVGFYGTDLGFNYKHNGTLNIMFGDTWNDSNAPCGIPPLKDDAHGTVPVTRPTWVPTTQSAGGACQQIVTVDKVAGETLNYTPITLQSNQRCGGLNGGCPYADDACDATGHCVLSLGWGRTPVGGFSDGTNAFGVFERADVRACNIFLPPCPSAFTCAPLGADFGYCVAANASSFGIPSPYNRVQHIEIGLQTSTRTTYLRGAQFVTNKFINPIATTVTSFTPSTGIGDYTENPANNKPTGIFMWGRPSYFTGSGEMPLFLLYQALPLTVTGSGRDVAINWAPQFYKGVVGGVPQWSASEKDAIPVTTYGGTPSYADFSRPLQGDIAWIPKLKKWVMLYGGDVPDWFGAIPDDQPRTGAIHFRMADNPWGPWTAPIPALDRYQNATSMACDSPAPAGFDDDANGNGISDSYQTTGTWQYTFESLAQAQWTSNCVVGDPKRPSKGGLGCTATPAGKSLERGNMYAPNLLPTWTEDVAQSSSQPYSRAANLYWYVSDWNPYKITLMSTLVRLPEPQATYSHKFQIRDNAGAMLRAVAPKPVPDGHAPRDPNVKLDLSNTGTATGDILVTHSVYIHTPQGYLQSQGTPPGLGYNAAKVTAAQWTLVLRSAGGANSTITVGSTQVAFKRVISGTTYYLTSSGGTLSLKTVLDASDNFKLTWECAPGEDCGLSSR